MEVRTCRNCGKLFNYLQGQPLCPACKRNLEEKYLEVKEYVWDHHSATIQEIAEDNDVSVKQIKQWIREERLTFSDKSPVGIECEKCGAMIRTGRYCEKCKSEMADNLQKIYATSPVKKNDRLQRDGERMRYLDRT